MKFWKTIELTFSKKKIIQNFHFFMVPKLFLKFFYHIFLFFCPKFEQNKTFEKFGFFNNPVYEFSYKFDIVLYQFLETRTSDITFMGYDKRAKVISFQPIPPLIFLYSPFKWNINFYYYLQKSE